MGPARWHSAPQSARFRVGTPLGRVPTARLTGTIEPLTFVDKLNALAVGPGALWVATGSAGILQRFDIPS